MGEQQYGGTGKVGIPRGWEAFSRMKILVIRLSAIGDIFFCTSLLGELKTLYPDCRITWLTEPMGSSILEGHPLLDRLIVLPRKDWATAFKRGRWKQLAGAMRDFLRRLRKEHYDLVIDPQGLIKSAIWARRARADQRIGINAREGSHLIYDEVLQVAKTDRPRILSEYRRLASRLGGDPERVRMHLHINASSQQEADRFLETHQLDAPVIFCPFTTRPQKHWFNRSWARLGESLSASGYGPVLILGGPADGLEAADIAASMDAPCVLAAGEPRSIGFALAILYRARAVVGVDTGLTHAGIGLKKPTIGLFGSTKPYLETGLECARILYHPLECSPCHRRPTCEGRFDCMQLHTPENVMENLIQVMG